MANRTKLFAACCVVACLLAVGCGKCKVKGKVTFADGSPLTAGTVNFTDDKNLFRGEIQNDGTFEMKTFKPGDGIDPGTYKVYLTETLQFGESGRKGQTKSLDGEDSVDFEVIGVSKATVDQKYSSAATSGLSITVEKSMTYDIVLE